MTQSRFPGFYRLAPDARLERLAERFSLSHEEVRLLQQGGLDVVRADKMVENCVGVFAMPLALGLNFRIDGVDVPVPMVIEEPSVVAAASNAARLVREAGGFTTDADPPHMIAQIQLVDVADPAGARDALEEARDTICELADAASPGLRRRGGGARTVEARAFPEDGMVVAHLIVDCGEAMGANAVNTMAEAVAPRLEAIAGGRVVLRILSNLADRRLARAACRIPEGLLAGDGFEGAEVAEGIVHAGRLAEIDPYRAATHNKGVMNGIDAVALATGNDWRGVEAGAHAYAAREGRYGSLTRWWREGGALHGSIELPMAIGVVGGSTRVHPTIEVVKKLMGDLSARRLAGVMAAAGLAQNLGALRALASSGIQRGHMKLHARQVALSAGASEADVDDLAGALVGAGTIGVDSARALLDHTKGTP